MEVAQQWKLFWIKRDRMFNIILIMIFVWLIGMTITNICVIIFLHDGKLYDPTKDKRGKDDDDLLMNM